MCSCSSRSPARMRLSFSYTNTGSIESDPIHPRDITSLLKDPLGFRVTINELVKRYTGVKIDRVAGIEARGFIVGSALAYQLGLGFVPNRKKGKLPAETVGHDYELEYGADRIEMHVDAVSKGERVLLVDDLIATGGTAGAACKLIESMGGKIVECCFVVDLPEILPEVLRCYFSDSKRSVL